MSGLQTIITWSVFIFLPLILPGCIASVGDDSPFYRNCVSICVTANCTNDYNSRNSKETSFPGNIIAWPCLEECRYHCMWVTVDAFLRRGWDVPQFHGRWPFVRFLGLQEPASVLFSLLNFSSHMIMLQLFRKEVPRTAPMYWVWHFHSLVCMHAWFWSSVFHGWETPLTEKMDYFCAYSMVLCSLYVMGLRFFSATINFKTLSLTVLCGGLFVYHVTYLSLVKFDYSYNMQANIIVGALNALGWLLWCAWPQSCTSAKSRKLCIISVLLAIASTALEILDFPPVFWSIDAHALWHLSTAFLPLLWYRFLIMDCNSMCVAHMEKQKKIF
ncbi:post-GPI attachment to proteins factor 3 [Ischnura elegans]|uniref:post-GPI attachment to proteins factor 3 n=1 Tax=Ischnura elegans TaxID=197161 RepID=UPI001ED86E13|nr:post-GPI attachment to proteins factor 3 [Ischnura elegans]